MAARNAGMLPVWMVRPAAAAWPPQRSSRCWQAVMAACRWKPAGARPLPRPLLPFDGDDDGRAAVALHQAAGHNADDAGVPALPRDNQHPVMGAGGVGFQRLPGGGQRSPAPPFGGRR